MTELVLKKSKTGILGLDEVLHGGLPSERVSLVCGGPGSAKTFLAMEFLVNGARVYTEPGLFISFEETAEELIANFAYVEFNLERLVKSKKLAIDHIMVDPSSTDENGVYDLEAMFIRIDYAAKAIQARRIVIDGIETLFSIFKNRNLIRNELVRIIRWLKKRNFTTIITAEQGDTGLTKHGLEAYVADCVLFLDHRVENQISTRRLRVVKYRGAHHQIDEFPFVVEASGLLIYPITSLQPGELASDEIYSTGITAIDKLVDKGGFYLGSSLYISGAPGLGKSLLCAQIVDNVCRSGKKSLLFSFEESASEIHRNSSGIGCDLDTWVNNGLLKVEASSASHLALENHLVRLYKITTDWQPDFVIIDPISALERAGSNIDVNRLLIRLQGFFKSRGTTSIYSSLAAASDCDSITLFGISSSMDNWVNLEFKGNRHKRHRELCIIKARGLKHSNEYHSYIISDRGFRLVK